MISVTADSNPIAASRLGLHLIPAFRAHRIGGLAKAILTADLGLAPISRPQGPRAPSDRQALYRHSDVQVKDPPFAPSTHSQLAIRDPRNGR